MLVTVVAFVALAGARRGAAALAALPLLALLGIPRIGHDWAWVLAVSSLAAVVAFAALRRAARSEPTARPASAGR